MNRPDAPGFAGEQVHAVIGRAKRTGRAAPHEVAPESLLGPVHRSVPDGFGQLHFVVTDFRRSWVARCAARANEVHGSSSSTAMNGPSCGSHYVGTFVVGPQGSS